MKLRARLGAGYLGALTALALSGATTALAQADKWGQDGKARLNQNTIGLAAGLPEGAPLRIGAELARALNDSDEMRILPIVTRGIFDNFVDLLQLKGVDAAIVEERRRGDRVDASGVGGQRHGGSCGFRRSGRRPAPSQPRWRSRCRPR